jgi:hypothetical protein
MLANSNHSYPAVGHRVHKSYFKTVKPKGATTHFGLPKSGGSSVKSYSGKTSWGKSSFGSGSKSGSGSSWGKKSGGSGGSKSFGSSRSGRR